VIETEFEVETVSDRARPATKRRAQEPRKSAGQARATARPAPPSAPDAPRPPAGRGDRAAGGGIVFVEDDSAPAERDPDDSLEAYMNEDDVPRRRT